MPDRLKPCVLPAWSALLALIILGPVLAPGYVLHLDMVFVPHQTLLPWNLGIGAGLPRSVPQDAVVSLLAGPLPGQILQKGVLLGALILAGVGAGRLAGPGLAVQMPAAAIYTWSAYVASRLLMGHWGLLWAFGLLPWIVLASRRARNRQQWLPLVVLCGLSALVPTGGVLAATTALLLLWWPGSPLTWPRNLGVTTLIIFVNMPWWFAALRSTSATVSDPLGLVVFGARADGVGGVLLSVLAGGGVWNSQATLGSRTGAFAAFTALVLLILTAVGYPRLLRTQRTEAIVLGMLGGIGLLWAWLSGVASDQGWAQQIVSAVPGGGLLRDAQKWTVWWVLLLALSAPRGMARLSERAADSLRLFLAGALAVLPLAAMPDLAAGGFGRLRPTTYPDSWHALREQLATSPVPGDVVSLPWGPFRRYAWNRSQVVLDPLPRYLTRTVVWNDALPVTVEGSLVQVGGDDPRAAAVSRVVASGKPLSGALGELGIAWMVVQRDQPGAASVDMAGAEKVWEAGDLQLWQIGGPVVVRSPEDRLLVAVDVAVLIFMLVAAGTWAVTAVRANRVAGRSGAS